MIQPREKHYKKGECLENRENTHVQGQYNISCIDTSSSTKRRNTMVAWEPGHYISTGYNHCFQRPLRGQ